MSSVRVLSLSERAGGGGGDLEVMNLSGWRALGGGCSRMLRVLLAVSLVRLLVLCLV